MSIIDREKALRNLAFAQTSNAYVAVTTIHINGALTSGGSGNAATTVGVHDLPIETALGVSSSGLADLLSNMRDDTIGIRLEGGSLIFSSKRSSYAINTCSPSIRAAPEDLTDASKVLVPFDSALRDALQHAPKFASRDIGSPHMHSIFFTADGAHALDGIRIFNHAASLSSISSVKGLFGKHVLLALKNFEDSFIILFDETHALIYDEETRWYLPQMEQLNDYSHMVPDAARDGRISMSFGKELIVAIKAVSSATSSEDVYLDFQDCDLEVSAVGSSGATAKEFLVVPRADGDLRMKFRASMLIEALSVGLKSDDNPKLHLMPERRCSQVVAGSATATTMAMSV